MFLTSRSCTADSTLGLTVAAVLLLAGPGMAQNGPAGSATTTTTTVAVPPATTTTTTTTTSTAKKAEPESKTVAQILKAFGAKNSLTIRYLPDGARMATAKVVTVPVEHAKIFQLEKLNEGQVRQVLRMAKLIYVTETELWNALREQPATSRFAPKDEKAKSSVVYIGSAEGELAVLKRSEECKVQARTLLNVGVGLGMKVANASARAALDAAQNRTADKDAVVVKKDNGKGLVEAIASRLKLQFKVNPPDAQPEEALPISEHEMEMVIRALEEHARRSYLEIYLLPKPDAFDCDHAGLTVSTSPAMSVVLLQKILGGDGEASANLGVELVSLDKDGRLVAPYALRHAWSEDFEYQRAYVATGAENSLKVSGVKAVVEGAIKDYFGAIGVAEPPSGPAPKVSPLVWKSGTAITIPSIQYKKRGSATGLQAVVWREKQIAALLVKVAANSDEPDDQLMALALIAQILAGGTVTLNLDPEDLSMTEENAAEVWRKIAKNSELETDLETLQLAMPALLGVSLLPVGVKVGGETVVAATAAKVRAAANFASSQAESLLSPGVTPVDTPKGTEAPMAQGLSPVATTDSSAKVEELKRALERSETELARSRTELQVSRLVDIASQSLMAMETAKAAAAPQAAAAAAEGEKKEEEKKDPPPPAEAQSDTPMLRGSAVLADVANNSLLVVTPGVKAGTAVEFMKYMEQLICELDTPRKMVEISVAVVDTDALVAEQWGTRFAVAGRGQVDNRPALGVAGFQAPLPVGNQRGAFSSILNPTVGVPQLPASTVESTALNQGLKVGSLIVGSSVQFLATLQALETEGKGKVLSRPSLLTTDNSEAVLSEETKFYLPATGLNAGTLAEVPVGLKITVTPQVVMLGEGADCREAVRLRINLKEGTGNGGNSLQGLPPGVVAVDNSQFKTIAVIEQGQSLMVAGRLRHEESGTEDRVPVLGRVPLVGRAFKNAGVQKRRQQRLVLITPSIVNSDARPSEAAAEAARLFHEPRLPMADPALQEIPPLVPEGVPPGK